MAKRSNLTQFLLTASSFAGGVALGMLLAPKSGKEYRKWINEQTTELADWADVQGRELLKKSSEQFSGVSSKVRNGIKDSIPDLYDATENIKLDESDFIGV
jgi:gas vesicle protein